MSEYVLKKEYDSFKSKVNDRFHKNELEKSRMNGKLNNVDADVKQIMENSEYMKRLWIKAIVTMVCSVVGSAIIGTGLIVWNVLSK